MSTPIAVLPRFLLPQLTWKSPTLGTLGLATRPIQSHPRNCHRPSCRRTIPLETVPTHQKYSAVAQTLRSLHRLPMASIRPSLFLLTRPFHTTAPRYRDHHFDTLKFVSRLKEEGFSEEQATAMMRVLSDVIEESIQNLTRTMVLREGIDPPSPSAFHHFIKTNT